MWPAPSVITGAPGERRADFEKTIQFLVDHSRCFEVVNLYPFMATPASEFVSLKKQPAPDTAMRLFQFVQTCVDLGLKVVMGEQCIEYYLFNRVQPRRLAES